MTVCLNNTDLARQRSSHGGFVSTRKSLGYFPLTRSLLPHWAWARTESPPANTGLWRHWTRTTMTHLTARQGSHASINFNMKNDQKYSDRGDAVQEHNYVCPGNVTHIKKDFFLTLLFRPVKIVNIIKHRFPFMLLLFYWYGGSAWSVVCACRRSYPNNKNDMK